MNNSSLALHHKLTVAAPENSPLFTTRRRRQPKLKVPKTATITTDLLRTKRKSSLVVLVYNKGVDPFTEIQVQQVMERQSKGLNPRKQTYFQPKLLEQAYESCRKICADRSTTYYLGWGQRTDELVDYAASNAEASAALDSWEQRLEDIFDGRPHDIPDIALAHTFQQFPLDIKPFKDLIKGMRMDTWKTRYDNYEELELYCYYVAATGCLMAIPIAGISPQHVSSTETIYEASLSLGIANQLTNILRDVTDQWREFTKMQIQRARKLYDQGQHVADQLDSSSRWPVWASIMLYKKILDKIEENSYDNLTKRAKVGTAEKFLTLPLAYAKAMGW
ncbi:Phytoene synthase 2 chloroplastic [Bienertia sinuspersici]